MATPQKGDVIVINTDRYGKPMLAMVTRTKDKRGRSGIWYRCWYRSTGDWGRTEYKWWVPHEEPRAAFLSEMKAQRCDVNAPVRPGRSR